MSIGNAFTSWEKIVGTHNISNADRSEELYGSDTNGNTRKLIGALTPSSTDDVQKIVAIANEELVRLYPISTGKNWGYGTSLPVVDDSVVLDLSKMDKIISFDEKLGTVTLEPGVTQKTLYDFLEKNKYPFLVPLTGAGPNCSILGNALERGYGVTQYSDHFGAVTTITVVLPDGSLYKSPIEDMGGVRIDRLYKYGVGPYLDGIFSQSNFGVVVEMTIALARKPPSVKLFMFPVRNEYELENVVSVLPEVLHSLGPVTSSFKFVSKAQFLAMSEGKKNNAESSKYLPEWVVTGSICGDKEIVSAARKIIKRKISSHVPILVFIDPVRFSRYKKLLKFLPLYSKFEHLIGILSETLHFYVGRPTFVALPLAYTGGGAMPAKEEDMDPGKDGCGLIWFSPLVPIDSKVIGTYNSFVISVMKKYNKQLRVTLTTLNERVFDSTIPIIFDKNNPDELLEAKQIYDELWNGSKEIGLMPYRLPTDEMHRLTNSGISSQNLASKIKKIVDPNNIISPGRYVS